MRFGLLLNVGELPGQDDHGEILERAIAYAEAAERLGFRDVWVTEHHFIPFGICPSALTLAGFLLGRTHTLRVGTAVCLVHLYHPLQLAEQVSLLDQVSGGRLDFGVGRGGYLHEVEAFSSVARWEVEVEAALDVLLPAWTEATVHSDNPLFPFAPVRLTPRPHTRPHPPLYVGSRTPATVERAAREGLPLLLYWGTDDDSRETLIGAYAEGAERHGRDPRAVDHVVSAIAFVTDMPERDRELLRHNLTWAFEAGNHPAVQSTDGRGHGDRAALAAGIVEAGAVGPPDLCIERLATTLERTGARHLTLLVEAAGDHKRTLENIERLATEVLPSVARQVGATGAATRSATAAVPTDG